MTFSFKSLAARPWLSLGLALLLLLTRMGHVGSAVALPDATLAVFFLAGMWIASGWVFVALLAIAALADQLAFASGVSDWCVTAAYVFLIPTYGALWLAGKFCRNVNLTSLQGSARVLAYVVAGSAVAFVISNCSFFWLSGYYTDISLAEIWSRTYMDIPWYMGWAVAYVAGGCAIAVLANFIKLRRAHATASDAR